MTILNWANLVIAIVLIGVLVTVHVVLRTISRDAEGFMGVLKGSGESSASTQCDAPGAVSRHGEPRNLVAVLGDRES